MNDSHSTTPDIAVIILNWNGEKMLRDYLPSVIAHTPASIADVIVADNGSTDGSLKLLAENFPGVKVLRFDKNHGFAGGYNLAIEQTRYRFTVLLNSDIEVKDDWLTPMWRYMKDHPEAGAVQPKIRSLTSPDMFEYAGASGGFIDRNGFPYCRGRIFDSVEKDNGQYDDIIDIFWATGAALMVDTALYLSVGGLDTRFFAHMEEIDLCWRIHLAGRRIAVVPQAVVYHLGGGSLPASNPRKTYLNFRNCLLMLHKNLPDTTRRRRLLKRRLLDTIAWAKFVVSGKWSFAGAVWRAHRDFAAMRKEYTTHPDRDLLASAPGAERNILLDYYMRRRRLYSEL